LAAFIKALLFVIAGEMGDKTQLLAMAMAGRFKPGQVMLGVFIATVLNHGLAVLVGAYLGTLIPMQTVSIAAGVLFLVFGLWTLRGDDDGDGLKKADRFGPVVTVAIAFFLAEMGDKTQLMTITIAAEFRQPVAVLMGTTTGMLIADGVGILFGAWICKHIPQSYIAWIAGMVFIFFGGLTLIRNLPARVLNPLTLLGFVVVMGAGIYLVGIRKGRHPEPCEAIAESDSPQLAPGAGKPNL
jgi:putative Ca2+/H+ antiporter (TMEM165/GDT1 family)